MSLNLYIDPTTHDIVVDNTGDLQMTSSDDENLSQKIEQRLSTFSGEWFLDVSMGVPYYERILKKNPNFTDVNSILLSVISTTNGVKDVVKFNVTYDTIERDYKVEFTCITSFGTTITNEVSI